jgi:hypothetical protein
VNRSLTALALVLALMTPATARTGKKLPTQGKAPATSAAKTYFPFEPPPAPRQLAMAGDQFGHFSDLFATEPNGVAARRASIAYSDFADLRGNGWFVMPSPVYGSGLPGGPDNIFPQDKQWRDPGLVPAIHIRSYAGARRGSDNIPIRNSAEELK